MLHGEGSHVLYHRNLIKRIRQIQTITWQVTCKKLLKGKIKTKEKTCTYFYKCPIDSKCSIKMTYMYSQDTGI